MMDDRPGAPRDDQRDYAVPPQYAAPPGPGSPPPPPEGAARPRQGPPLAAPEDPDAAMWRPSPVSGEAGRWGPAPPVRGSTALLDRPTVARRAVVAPPVAPMALPGTAQGGWEWERSHRLRNALLVAAAILLVGSLIAAAIVFRNHRDGKKTPSRTTPTSQAPTDVTIEPVVPGIGGTGGVPTVPSVSPVSIVPVAPATTAAPVTTPATVAPVATTAAPATTPATNPPVTATTNPPYNGPRPTTSTTVPRTTTTTKPPNQG